MLLLLWFAPRHDPDGREKRFLDVPQRQDLVRVFFFGCRRRNVATRNLVEFLIFSVVPIFTPHS
jgi:hypothetical protein